MFSPCNAIDANRTTCQGYSYVYVVNNVCKGRPLQTQINTHVGMTYACFHCIYGGFIIRVSSQFFTHLFRLFQACNQFHIIMFHTHYFNTQPCLLMVHTSYFLCNHFQICVILHTFYATTLTYVSHIILFIQPLSLMFHISYFACNHFHMLHTSYFTCNHFRSCFIHHTLQATIFTHVTYFILYMQPLSHVTYFTCNQFHSCYILHTLHASTFTHVTYFIL